MEQIIKFKDKITTYVGRNGNGKCIGLNLFYASPDVNEFWITAINSKNRCARCEILVPVNSIPEIIESLQKIQKHSEEAMSLQK